MSQYDTIKGEGCVKCILPRTEAKADEFDEAQIM